MMTTTPPQPLPQSQLGWQEHGDEIDLREVFATLWRGKLVITAITLCVVATAVCITFAFDKRYDAAVVFTAVPDNGTSGSLGGGGGLGAQLGGLASLAGLSLSGNERKAEFLAVLQSQSLAERFITENNLLPVFFKDDWDSVLSQWENQEDAPTLWEAGQYFKKKVRRLTTDNKTGISTLTISWTDPSVASAWANQLLAMANEYVRSRAISEAEGNIDYLNEQLSKTTVVAVQNSITRLLENEINRAMLARAGQEYAFRVIDPAVKPDRASFPNRKLFAALGFVLGLLVSVAVVLIRDALSVDVQSQSRAIASARS